MWLRNGGAVSSSVCAQWRRPRRRRQRQSTGSGLFWSNSNEDARVVAFLLCLLHLNVVNVGHCNHNHRSWGGSFVFLAAASSSINYNAYNYDQNPMQFTPDGRLLQVEYASSAADWSPPLVVMEWFDGSVTTQIEKAGEVEQDNDEQEVPLPPSCLVLLTIPRQSAAMEALRNGGHDNGVDRDVPFLATPMPPQQRIVMLKNDNDDDDDNNYNGRSSSCCIGLSGVLADSLALLQMTMEKDTQRMVRQRSPWALTQALANGCQRNTLGGGIRPYGSSLVVCGYDQDYRYHDTCGTKTTHRHTPCSFVYQTDPSGGIIRHAPHRQVDLDLRNEWAGRRKQHGDAVQCFCRVRCIVGGSPTLQRQLHQSIVRAMTKLEEDHRQQQQQADLLSKATTLSLADRIATLSRVLIRETRKDDTPSENDSGKKNHGGGDEAASALSQLPPLEVVVISPKLGSHRLDTKQLLGIQNLILAQEKAEQDTTKRRKWS